MNFDDAIKAHAAWKMKLSRYINKPDGSLKPEDIEPDNLCVLGQWIYGDGKSYSNLEEYKELKECHSKFHKCAASIVRKADSGEKLSEELTFSSNSEYSNLSGTIVSLIMNMKRKVG